MSPARSLRRLRGLLSLAIALSSQGTGSAADDLRAWLERPILTTNLPLAEVQVFCEARVPLMPAVKTAAEWERHADRMRRDTLEKIVFRGEAARRWRDAPARVEWLEMIDGGPGYRIRKVRYEALPGLWIPALLYEPENLSGRAPVHLAVNGHDAKGKAADYKQIRCINLAKRGVLSLNAEWLNMGQLRAPGFKHYAMNQLDLCGASGLAPFYLAMSRALDLLLAHEHADPERVAVSGLSGGGWQTIVISALDPRVTLANPVAGYSSYRTRARFTSDLGDSEQTPNDLATVTDYAHLTAMLAGRALLLTYNAKDQCCFRADHALRPLQDAAEPVFDLHGQAHRLRTHVNHDPGTHNFDRENREQLYRMVGDIFFPGDRDYSGKEIPSEAEVKTNTLLHVELPADNLDFNQLALALAAPLPRDPDLAARKPEAARRKLRELVKYPDYKVSAEQVGDAEGDGTRVVFWRLRMGEDWTVPVTELVPPNPRGTTLLVADTGRSGAGTAVALDPFYFGESKIVTRDFLYAMLVACVGERPLGIQAGQIAAAARWARARLGDPVQLAAVGPRTGTVALVATALETRAIGRLELRQPLRSLKEVIQLNWSVDQRPELFCFGLLEAFDLPQLIALVAPRPVVVKDVDERSGWADGR
jgi:hypothetical protein